MGEHFANTESSCQRAQEALHASPIHAMRKLLVERCGESLVISGKVSSFYQKQMAQEIVLAVTREFPLVNSVDVLK